LISAEMLESVRPRHRHMGNPEEAHNRDRHSLPARTLHIQSGRRPAVPADIRSKHPGQHLDYCDCPTESVEVYRTAPAT
jgi:hypothetical protein